MMKRPHVYVSAEHLDRTNTIYSAPFTAAPTVTKRDYARWVLESQMANFTIPALRPLRLDAESRHLARNSD